MKDVVHGHRTCVLWLAVAGLAGCSGGAGQADREVELGKNYARQGKLREATEAYQRALDADRKHGEAYYRLALIDWDLGRGTTLERNLRSAVELQPENADALEKLSELYLLSYQSDDNATRRQTYATEMAQLAERLLRLNPDSHQGIRIQGYAALYGKDYRTAIASFERALQVNPTVASADTLAGDLFGAMVLGNRTTEAESFAHSYLANHPAATPVYAALVSHYQKTNQPSKALAVLEKRTSENPRDVDARIQLASAYRSAGKSAEAERTFQQIVSDPTTFPSGILLVGDFYANAGRESDAMRIYKLGEQRQPDRRSVFRLKQAVLLRRQNQGAAALQIVDEVLKQQPDLDARLMKYSLLADGGYAGGATAAVQDLTELREKYPKDARVLIELGRAYLAAGFTQEAGEALKDAIFRAPQSAEAHEALARCYEAQGQFGLMRNAAERAFTLDSRSRSALLLRGTAYSHLGLNDKVREDLVNVLRYWPDSTEARYYLATVDAAEQKWNEAETGFRKLADAGDKRAIIGMAEVYSQQQHFGPAMAILRKAMANDSKSLDLRLAYAKAASSAGDHDAALATLKSLSIEHPDDASIRLQLVDAYRRKGDTQAALQEARSAAKTIPQEPGVLLQLAELLESQPGNNAEVRQLYETVLELRSDDPRAASKLAELLAANPSEWGRAMDLVQRAARAGTADLDVLSRLAFVNSATDHHKEAISLYRSLVSRYPRNLKLRLDLARALLRSGQHPQARQELESALRSNPTPEEADAIRTALSNL